MNLHKSLFCLIALFAILIIPVSATTITFSDMNIGTNQKLLIYNPMASGNESQFLGEYNTNSTIVLDGVNYIFVLKPGANNWFDSPLNAIELFKASLPPILVFALFFGVIVGIIAIFWHLFRK